MVAPVSSVSEASSFASHRLDVGRWRHYHESNNLNNNVLVAVTAIMVTT